MPGWINAARHLQVDLSRRTTSASAKCEGVYEFANANLQFRRYELALTRAMREAVASRTHHETRSFA